MAKKMDYQWNGKTTERSSTVSIVERDIQADTSNPQIERLLSELRTGYTDWKNTEIKSVNLLHDSVNASKDNTSSYAAQDITR